MFSKNGKSKKGLFMYLPHIPIERNQFWEESIKRKNILIASLVFVVAFCPLAIYFTYLLVR